MHNETAEYSGNGMVLGFAFGLVLGPPNGVGMIFDALIGLVVGAAVAQGKSD